MSLRCHIEFKGKGERLLWLEDLSSPSLTYAPADIPDIPGTELSQLLEITSGDCLHSEIDSRELAADIAAELKRIVSHLPAFSEEPVVALPPSFAKLIGLTRDKLLISEFIAKFE